MGAHIHGTGGGPSTRAERESQHGSMCRQHVAACCGSIYAALDSNLKPRKSPAREVLPILRTTFPNLSPLLFVG